MEEIVYCDVELNKKIVIIRTVILVTMRKTTNKEMDTLLRLYNVMTWYVFVNIYLGKYSVNLKLKSTLI